MTPLHPHQQLLARRLASHVDVAVVRVAAEGMATSLKLAAPIGEQDFRQQRRKRPTLQFALSALGDQPVMHQARFQVVPDQFEHAHIHHPPGNPRHQDAVIRPVEGNYDRLPLSTTFLNRSSSRERVTRSKANASRSE